MGLGSIFSSIAKAGTKTAAKDTGKEAAEATAKKSILTTLKNNPKAALAAGGLGALALYANTTGKPVAAATPGQASSGDSMANGPQTTDGTGQTASDAAAAGGSSAAGDSGAPDAGGTDSSKLVLGGVAVAALVIVILIVVLLSHKKKLPAQYMQMPSPAYYPMQQPMYYGPPGRP